MSRITQHIKFVYLFRLQRTVHMTDNKQLDTIPKTTCLTSRDTKTNIPKNSICVFDT